MKKLIYFLTLLLLVFSVAGCSSTTAKSEDKGTVKLSTKKAKSIQVTPTNLEIKPSKEKNKKELVITYDIKNLSEKKLGVVAADFFLGDEDDDQYFYAKGSVKNINEVLKPGEKATGKGYYIIDKNLKKAELQYQPIDSKENITWKNITIPSDLNDKN